MDILSSVFSIEGTVIVPFDIEVGTKVRFDSEVENCLIGYLIQQKGTLSSQSSWIALGEEILKGRNEFSVLHVAKDGSVYPNGTVIIEISANMDIEVNGSYLCVSNRSMIVA